MTPAGLNLADELGIVVLLEEAVTGHHRGINVGGVNGIGRFLRVGAHHWPGGYLVSRGARSLVSRG